jgi:hypothetical protein
LCCVGSLFLFTQVHSHTNNLYRKVGMGSIEFFVFIHRRKIFSNFMESTRLCWEHLQSGFSVELSRVSVWRKISLIFWFNHHIHFNFIQICITHSQIIEDETRVHFYECSKKRQFWIHEQTVSVARIQCMWFLPFNSLNSEFLMFILPLINLDKIKNFVTRLLFSSKLHGIQAGPNTCPICRKEPIQTPYISNCNHLFCYYCLKQNTMMDSNFACPVCGSLITQMNRWNGTLHQW